MHPQVTCFVHASSFNFSPIQRSFNFPNFKGINCTLKRCNKISHCALLRTKDHHTSLPSPWIEKQYCVLECACTDSPDYVIFMHSMVWCTVQNWGITLRQLINNYLLYFKALHVICYWEWVKLSWFQIGLSKLQCPHSLYI